MAERTLNFSAEQIDVRLGQAHSHANMALLDALTALPTNGREVEFNVSATHIQWRYAGTTAWINLIALDTLTGNPGVSPSITVKENTLETYVLTIETADGKFNTPNLRGGGGGGGGSSSFTAKPFLILDTDWVNSTDFANYAYHADINLPGITPSHTTLISFAAESIVAVNRAIIMPTGVEQTDSVRIYAMRSTETNIQGTCFILQGEVPEEWQ